MKKYLSLIAVSVLALGINNANAAETSVNGTATATILAASGISQTQELDFGNVLKTAAHDVVINTEGVRNGNTSYLVGGGTPQQGKFTITGQDGQAIKISVPTSIELKKENSSSTLTVSNVTMKIGTGAEQAAANSVAATISGTSLALAVGGTLKVTTAAEEGEYNGNYTVTISY